MSTERPEPEDYDEDHDATPDASGGTGGAGDTSVAGPGSDAAAGGEKRKRRRPPAVVGAVAAAVLLAGGGGAYVAGTAGGGPGGDGGPGSSGAGADGTPPPLALDGYADGSGEGTVPAVPPDGTTYRADGDLPGGPHSAPVYRAAGEVTSAEVARLARALGVEGTPRAEGGSWRVGAAGDGAGPFLRVDVRAPGTWTFSRYAPGTDNCEKPDVCAAGTTGGTPVGEAAAKKAAAPVLAAVGQDTAELDAGQVMGGLRVVNADPEVGGLPTYGWTTGIQVGGDGRVVGGSGNLKAPVEGDTYPTIGSREALDLMNGPGRVDGGGRQGIGGCAGPVPLRQDEEPCERPTLAPEPEPVAVTDAVFGLAAHHVDGERALVPSWLFEARPDGAGRSFTVTHPAVEPDRLATAEPPASAPAGSPTRVPGKPGGDVPTSAPATREVDIEGWTADGKDLTVSFWGGVCHTYAASADEETGRVTVTATEKPSPPDKVCVLIAKAVERTVRLDAPVGDREVVGPDGKEIPEGGLSGASEGKK
ncbi:hypothetical protein [Streptomyces sp. CRN 30]|uniref:hypothetical protein n=1 Tax=Streptomyces sp. CRN 30 TaxID=3075613 RepID=UPI002A7FA7BE|nr:hypothetical protein [Streptomyces sp. CRN 30]